MGLYGKNGADGTHLQAPPSHLPVACLRSPGIDRGGTPASKCILLERHLARIDGMQQRGEDGPGGREGEV